MPVRLWSPCIYSNCPHDLFSSSELRSSGLRDEGSLGRLAREDQVLVVCVASGQMFLWRLQDLLGGSVSKSFRLRIKLDCRSLQLTRSHPVYPSNP